MESVAPMSAAAPLVSPVTSGAGGMGGALPAPLPIPGTDVAMPMDDVPAPAFVFPPPGMAPLAPAPAMEEMAAAAGDQEVESDGDELEMFLIDGMLMDEYDAAEYFDHKYKVDF